MMVKLVSELMGPLPVEMDVGASISDAARRMRDSGIGNVLVTENGSVCGIVTDRDIVVRCVAEHEDVKGHTLGEICSRQLITARPDEDSDTAVTRMRENAVRRLVVVDGETPIGVLSLGDAAVAKDPQSALADISAAPANT